MKQVLAILLISGLTACATSNAPATVDAECRVFRDPGFAVKGETRRDQRWISQTQEAGIRVCDWNRPEAD